MYLLISNDPTIKLEKVLQFIFAKEALLITLKASNIFRGCWGDAKKLTFTKNQTAKPNDMFVKNIDAHKVLLLHIKHF